MPSLLFSRRSTGRDELGPLGLPDVSRDWRRLTRTQQQRRPAAGTQNLVRDAAEKQPGHAPTVGREREDVRIGIGGHVNPEDGGIDGGLKREWAEEIEADFVPEFKPLGVLNDDDNSVGAVHLGLVFTADAGGRPVEIRERDKLSGRFASFAEVTEVTDALETWSALLFDFLTARS